MQVWNQEVYGVFYSSDFLHSDLLLDKNLAHYFFRAL